MAPQPSAAEMHRALARSDASYDGVFFAGVRTTGIFCRPSCRARKPKPKNVEFFATQREALFSGYRPCKRCRPLDTDGKPPTWVENLLRRIDAEPTGRIGAAELRRLGVEPARARRYFQQHHGMSFQAYCRARRLGDAFHRIKGGSPVSAVAHSSGFESESGFRAAFARVFGSAPSGARQGMAITLSWIESEVGPLVVGATDEGICLLEFSDRRMLETQLKTLRRRFRAALVPGRHRLVDELQRQLDQYFAGRRREFELPLVHPGTPFQQKVWKALLSIPYGSTRSYQDVARLVGHPRAVRAVGTANGMNRIAILVPCHRVVNSNGQLGGYGGGLWRKRALLDLERGQRSPAPLVRYTAKVPSQCPPS
jgi:AraC family transcriptional regulator, regulatory protein of adaptative response / methylated-DNA-[protein]-cysteine methyltransferase